MLSSILPKIQICLTLTHIFPFMKSSFMSSGSEQKYEYNNFHKFAIEKLFFEKY